MSLFVSILAQRRAVYNFCNLHLASYHTVGGWLPTVTSIQHHLTNSHVANDCLRYMHTDSKYWQASNAWTFEKTFSWNKNRRYNQGMFWDLWHLLCMYLKSVTNPVAMSSCPAHDGFLSSVTWEPAYHGGLQRLCLVSSLHQAGRRRVIREIFLITAFNTNEMHKWITVFGLRTCTGYVSFSNSGNIYLTIEKIRDIFTLAYIDLMYLK